MPEAVADLEVPEPGCGELSFEVHLPQSFGQPFVTGVDGCPAGQRDAATGCQDPLDFAVRGAGVRGELDRINAQHRVGRPV